MTRLCNSQLFQNSSIGPQKCLTTLSNRQNKATRIDYRYFWWRVWPTVATHVESCELHKQVV